MPKYVLAYHGGKMPESPEEGEKVMAAWNTWIAKMGSHMVDVGNPTSAAKTVGADGKISDGGGANPLSGYSIIEAANLDEAAMMAQGCPQIAAGGTIQVAETIAM
ncbi:MAG: hypothetical protein EOP20_02425 [Hyphomicrobiales bacterium]|nr:MAG: hypothetical protein EOP20_02425 [Hyphomicrobiales bacterium]